MTDPRIPAALLDPVVAFFRPQRVILFSSWARGEACDDSDIDLLVILDDDAPLDLITLAAGYRAHKSYRQAADVIPIRASTFARKCRVPGTLASAAAREGVVVYERA